MVAVHVLDSPLLVMTTPSCLGLNIEKYTAQAMIVAGVQVVLSMWRAPDPARQQQGFHRIGCRSAIPFKPWGSFNRDVNSCCGILQCLPEDVWM